MSKRPPFEPHFYAKHLKATGDFASDGTILWRWTGSHWEPFEEKHGKTHAYRWLVDHDREHISDAFAGQAYAAAVRWVDALPPVDPTKVILPVKNGYLHLDENGFSLQPHDRALGLQHVLQCDYSPTAPEPERFNTFLKRVLPDPDVLARVQEYIGYTFLSDARFQRAQLWLGEGANGKGTLANIVQALHHRTAAVQLDALEGFKLSGMIGASLIYCDEAPQRGIHEQTLKSLIAGESVMIDRKYQDPLTLRVYGKWLVLANHFPAITDQSSGFWRRWDIVPFNVIIPERDRQPLLEQTIVANELSGVLNWAIGGLIRLLGRGSFDVALPAPMKAILHQAKTETNSVQAWFDAVDCQPADEARTPKTKVYQYYADWCRSNGMAPVSSIKFWKRLGEVMGPGKLLDERIRTADGSQPRCCNLNLGLSENRAKFDIGLCQDYQDPGTS
jgi:putative DNA primase/helicase